MEIFVCIFEQFRDPLYNFVTSWFITVRSPSPHPQAGGLPLVGCPRLIIQYFRSSPSYLEAVPCIHYPRMRF